jgi:Peptidase U49
VAADPSTLNTEQRAIRDLSLIAIAYAFLHEIRHVMFRHPEEAKLDDPAEELACDAFARDFLLDHVSAYVAKSGEPIDLVRAKRAAAISLGAFAVYEVTAPEHRRGSSKYPPFADRFATLIAHAAVPADSYFWVFAATLLLATLRRQNYADAVQAATPPELCETLITLIRGQAWVHR